MGIFERKIWQQELNLNDTKVWDKPYYKLGEVFLTQGGISKKFNNKHVVTTWYCPKSIKVHPLIDKTKLKQSGTHCLWIDGIGNITKIKTTIKQRPWHVNKK